MRLFIYSFLNGLRSGIPLCCIINFCIKEYKGIEFIAAHMKEIVYKNEILPNEVEYVPCKRCFVNSKFRKIRMNGTRYDILLPLKNLSPNAQKVHP